MGRMLGIEKLAASVLSKILPQKPEAGEAHPIWEQPDATYLDLPQAFSTQTSLLTPAPQAIGSEITAAVNYLQALSPAAVPTRRLKRNL